jgi:hypothetical protein
MTNKRTNLYAVCLCVGILFVSLTTAQTAGLYTFKGQIKGENAAPFVNGALVFMYDSTGVAYSVPSDTNGFFVMSGLKPSSYSVRITARNYPVQYYNPNGNTDSPIYKFTLQADVNITVFLTQAPSPTFSAYGLIKGIVFDSVAGPLANATVSLTRLGNQDLIAMAYTDNAGNFSVRVPAISQILYVEYTGYPRQYWTPSGMKSVQTSAAMFSVNANDTLRFTIKMLSNPQSTYPMPNMGAISGTVLVRSAGTAAVGMRVSAIARYTMSGSLAQMDLTYPTLYFDSVAANGSYSIKNLPAGDYWVYASGGGYVTQFFPQNDFPENASIVHVDTQMISMIDFSVRKGGSLQGRLFTSAQTPLLGYTIYANMVGHSLRQKAASDSAGRYLIQGLNAGTWYLSVDTRDYFVDWRTAKSEYLVQEGTTVTCDPLFLQRGGFISGTIQPPAMYDSVGNNGFEIALFSDTLLRQTPNGTMYCYEYHTAMANPVTSSTFSSGVCPAGNWYLLIRPPVPSIPRNGSVQYVMSRSYCFGTTATAGMLRASQPATILSGDTLRNVNASFGNGYSFLGTIRFPDTAHVTWARVDACIKDGSFMIPVCHGYLSQGDSVFQLTGLVPGIQYYLHVDADGFTPQYWSPDGGMSVEPAGAYIFSTSGFVKPVIRVQRTPSGYYSNYTPLSLFTSVDPSRRLVVQWNADASLQVDTFFLYSKDLRGAVTVAVAVPRQQGQSQYSWTETRDWISNQYAYVLVAKGQHYTVRSQMIGFNYSRVPVAKDSLGIFIAGERSGISIQWTVDSTYQPRTIDSVTLYRKSATEDWAVLLKENARSSWLGDDKWDKTKDVGKTFFYKCALAQAGGAIRWSGVASFTIDAAFISRLSRHLTVGINETYKKIQDAIDACRDYDVVEVRPGTYSENLNTKGKLLTIEGAWTSGVPPVLDGSGGNAITVPFCSQERPWDNVQIRGLKIQNAHTGIVSAAPLWVNGCLFVDIFNQAINLSTDTAAMARAAQNDPFYSYTIALNAYQCTFVGSSGTNSVVRAVSQGTADTSGSLGSLAGLGPYLLSPAILFGATASIGNSIISDFPTQTFPAEVSGPSSSVNFSSCDFWNIATAIPATAQNRITADSFTVRRNPAFVDNVYYFIPDSSQLRHMASNGKGIGYDNLRFEYNQGPAPVKNLRVTVSGPRRVSLSWSALPATEKVTSYVVIRAKAIDSLFYIDEQSQWEMKVSEDSMFSVLDTFITVDTLYTDATAAPGARVVYLVVGRTASGEMGRVDMPYPPSLSSYVTAIPVPVAVRSVSSSVYSFTTAAVAWPTVGSGVRYEVYKFTLDPSALQKSTARTATLPMDSNSARLLIQNHRYTSLDSFFTADTFFVDSGLAPMTPYLYAVALLDSGSAHVGLLNKALAYSLVMIQAGSFTGTGSVRLGGGNWHMVGAWGNGVMSFAPGSFTIYHWDDFKQPDKLLSQYSAVNEMQPGLGYWFRAEKDTALAIAVDSMFANSGIGRSAVKTIELKKGQTGWNQVASAYPYSVMPQWLQTFTAWEWVSDSNMYTKAVMLDPWKAYWIQTDRDTSLELSGLPLPGRALAKKTEGIAWELRVSLLGKNSADPDNFCGVASPAMKKPQLLKSAEPPQAFDYPQLFFVDPSGQGAGKLARFFTGERATKYEWMVGVSPSAENMTIAVGGIHGLPKNMVAFWVQSGVAYNLRASAQVPVGRHSETVYGYLVVTSNPDDIALYTGQVMLKNGFPNPFTKTVTIEFVIPYAFNANGIKIDGERRAVSIDMFNIAGRHVARLISGAVSVGVHRTVWDGRNSAGAAVSSGYYIVRMAGKEFQKVSMLCKIQ